MIAAVRLTMEVGWVGNSGCRRTSRMNLLRDLVLCQRSLLRLFRRLSREESHQRWPSSFHQRLFLLRDKRGLVGSLSASDVHEELAAEAKN